MPKYDSQYATPPAPIAHVTLRNPETQAEITSVAMLIDTGADITLIPHEAVLQIGCLPHNSHLLSGFDGTTNSYGEVFVEMILLDKSFKGQFLVIEQSTGIIGRNILNFLVLTFDGPRLHWEETKKP